MPIKFKLLTKPQPRNIPLVFFMSEGDDITAYSLFKFLGEEEKEYLKKIKKSVNPREKEVKLFVMPATGRKVLTVGVCKKSGFSASKAVLAARIAVQAAKKEKIKKFAFWAAPMDGAETTRKFYEAVAVNAMMANFEFTKYKTPPKEGFGFVEEIQALAAKPDKKSEDNRQKNIAQRTGRADQSVRRDFS